MENENLKKTVMAAIDKCEETSDAYYKQMFQSGSKLMNEVVAAIGSFIDELSSKVEGFDMMSFLTKLQEALRAMEEQDYVLLADILTYDIKDQLESAAMEL